MNSSFLEVGKENNMDQDKGTGAGTEGGNVFSKSLKQLEGKFDKLLGRNISPELINKNIFGSVLFFIIVICLVPFLLFKFKLYDFLEVYFPNVDLIATSFSFDDGPFKSNIFKYLYTDDTPLIGYISQTLINYVAVMSIIFIVVRSAVVHKNIAAGLSKAAIICFTTYLLPNRYVLTGMTLIDHIIHNHIVSHSLVWFIVVFLGLVLSSLCIYGEALLIKHFSPTIAKFFINILKVNTERSKKYVDSHAIQRKGKK